MEFITYVEVKPWHSRGTGGDRVCHWKVLTPCVKRWGIFLAGDKLTTYNVNSRSLTNSCKYKIHVKGHLSFQNLQEKNSKGKHSMFSWNSQKKKNWQETIFQGVGIRQLFLLRRRKKKKEKKTML